MIPPHHTPTISLSFSSRQIVATIFLGAFILAGNLVKSATFQGLGTLPGGNFSNAYAISADGSVVVGYGSNANGASEAFRWSNSIITGLGDLPDGNFASFATAVSADGSVIVGYGSNANGDSEAFRWSNNTMTALGDLLGGNFASLAYATSADGSVVVGYGSNINGNSEAFRWSNNIMIGLGTLPGGGYSVASAVSADGSVVVGYASNANGDDEAFRWSNNIMTGLGDLPGGNFASAANAVSADGSVVVGYGSNVDGDLEAFRWFNNVMTGLGTLPGGTSSIANAVSADGSVIVGSSSNANGASEAFRWDATYGMQSLNALLSTAGVNLTGWTLTHATGMSADGKTIVGYGTHNGNTEAWIATQVSGLIINPPPLPPSVSISGKKKITTTKLKYTLKGTALGSVSSVKVKVGNSSKIAIGTYAWKFTIKKLKLGKNKVLVTATGPGGISAPAKAIIIRK